MYKDAYQPQEAYEMILSGDCGVFNPKLINCFKIVKNDFEKLAAQVV